MIARKMTGACMFGSSEFALMTKRRSTNLNSYECHQSAGPICMVKSIAVSSISDKQSQSLGVGGIYIHKLRSTVSGHHAGIKLLHTIHKNLENNRSVASDL